MPNRLSYKRVAKGLGSKTKPTNLILPRKNTNISSMIERNYEARRHLTKNEKGGTRENGYWVTISWGHEAYIPAYIVVQIYWDLLRRRTEILTSLFLLYAKKTGSGEPDQSRCIYAWFSLRYSCNFVPLYGDGFDFIPSFSFLGRHVEELPNLIVWVVPWQLKRPVKDTRTQSGPRTFFFVPRSSLLLFLFFLAACKSTSILQLFALPSLNHP